MNIDQIINPGEVFERLAANKQPYHDNYYAMYSSILGGIITDPVLMMIPIDDHLVHRGDGVFESIKCVNGYIYNLQAHLDRLVRSLTPLSMALPGSLDEIIEITKATIRASGKKDCMIRLLVSRGPGSLNVNPYDPPATQLYIVVAKLSAPFMTQHQEGARTRTSSIPVKSSFFARVKTCNYLPNVLMKKEAVDLDVDFVVAFDTDGFLAEGATENVAIVSSENILTIPHASHILAGTTMKRILELAQPLTENGLLQGIGEANISRQDLLSAREVLIFGTTTNVTAVVEYDGQPIGTGKPGPVYEKLSQLLEDDIQKNTRLLTPVYEGD